MTATVTALPGTRVITIPERSPMARGILLAWLAKRETEMPDLLPRAVVANELAANAAESLTGDRLTRAWAAYLQAVQEESDAEDGFGFPSAGGAARVNAQAALAVLVHGEGR
jgi:hypothetical protein